MEKEFLCEQCDAEYEILHREKEKASFCPFCGWQQPEEDEEEDNSWDDEQLSYDNPWTHNGELVDSEILDNYLGFVYLITNLSNQRMYLGKKLLKRTKTKQVKGKKKRTQVESDWKDYYGSNKELVEEIKTSSIYNYKREILRLCKTKGECNYFEAKYQFEKGVLESELWYNSWIMVKVHKAHLPKQL